ncbi:MAG TPA: DMT family transporter, partial [Paludibacteraceae bacterium]|nr:DMT family transporter [Paludibacteraceae bacterium]
ALCWTMSALFFEKAGHKIGSLTVNVIRLSLAVVFLGITTFFTRGFFFPTDATHYQWFWLGLSGIIGFFLGDLFLFKSYMVIGSRTAQLIMSLCPMLTALIGWFFLDEKLSLKSILGIVICVTGIIIAISNRNLKLNIPFKGFLLAFGGALGQAVGLILSKKGIGNYDPVAATQIRALFGLVCFALFITFLGRWKQVSAAFTNKSALKSVTVGTFFGPFVGVALSMFAIQHTKTGIASTLMALVPVFIIWPSAVMFKERITIPQIIGAFVSIAGVSLFFL